MPLEFQSVNRGRVAFGFFNIESDLLLLNHLFIFASDFCEYVQKLSNVTGLEYNENWNGYHIENDRDVGDLMGAIHGVRYVGFIGETYKLFPFPKIQDEFKQNPDGFQTRKEIEKLIQNYGTKTLIQIRANLKEDEISMGKYIFSKEEFHRLIRYVWDGGMPKWKNQSPPHYVLEMKNRIYSSNNYWLKGLQLK